MEATALSWPAVTTIPWLINAFWHLALDLAFHSLAWSLVLTIILCCAEGVPTKLFGKPFPGVLLIGCPIVFLYFSALFFTFGHVLYMVAPLWDAFRPDGDQVVRAFTFLCYSADIYVLQGSVLYTAGTGLSILISVSLGMPVAWLINSELHNDGSGGQGGTEDAAG